MSFILLLAAQAAGQEVTTFHPLPSQRQQDQAQQEGCLSAEPKQAAPKPEEQIAVLSVRRVSPDANVVFVPPPPQPPEERAEVQCP